MKPEHTLGPWRQGKAGGSIISDHCDGLHLTHPDHQEENLKYYGGHVIAETVAPCNIHVICAAPDLLEALNEIHRFSQGQSGYRNSPAEEKTIAALVKAEGEQPINNQDLEDQSPCVGCQNIARCEEHSVACHRFANFAATGKVDPRLRIVPRELFFYRCIKGELTESDKEDDIYVVVTERDNFDPGAPNCRPIMFEQYTDNATLEVANKAYKEQLSGRYGNAKIAKLVFID